MAALVCRVLLFSCIGVRGSERLKSMRDMLSRSCCGPLSGDVYPHGFPLEVFTPYFIGIKMSTSSLSSYRDASVFKSTALQTPVGCMHKAHLDRMKQFSLEPDFLQNPDQGSVLIKV